MAGKPYYLPAGSHPPNGDAVPTGPHSATNNVALGHHPNTAIAHRRYQAGTSDALPILPGMIGGMHAPRILLVDDDPNLLVLLADQLRADGYEITTARDGDPAMTLDLARGRIVVEERVGLGTQRVEIALDPVVD